MRFWLGAAVGVLLSATAGFATQTGRVLIGWSVEKDGRLVCSDPVMEPGISLIECD